MVTPKTRTSLLLIGFCVLIGASGLVCLDGWRSAGSKPVRERSLPSQFVWTGESPVSRLGILLVGSREGPIGDLTGRVSLVAYALHGEPAQLIKTDDWQSDSSVSAVSGLHVYPAAGTHSLICAIDVVGVGSTGVLVLGHHGAGSLATLYADVNKGNPRLLRRGGVFEVVEVWPIYYLEDTDWMPTDEYDGHVLAKRIWRQSRDGEFRLFSTMPAVDEEKALPKEEFQDLLGKRRAYESQRGCETGTGRVSRSVR